jgi:Asp/Glu/hydantoin racemase
VSEPTSGNDSPQAPEVVDERNLAAREPTASTDTTPVTPKHIHTLADTREWLAYALLLLLAILTIGAGVAVILAPQEEPAIDELLKFIYTPVVGLVSSVVGFYFGAQSVGQGGSK